MSNADYPALSNIHLNADSGYRRPPQIPLKDRLDGPALGFMTDFTVTEPITTSPDVPIDAALEYMKKAGVRLLLVTDPNERLVGVVTAQDIQGERPIGLVETTRTPRSELTVGQVMTPQADITVLNLLSVRNAQIGHVVETLHQLERQHVLVVEVNEEAGSHTVRGLFSTSQIGKQLHMDVSHTMAHAHSLAEMVHEMN
jgi:CBS domain containing-hemolysin-like protein